MQIIFYLLATAVVYLIFRKIKNSGKIVSIFLSLLWIWVGTVYHIIYFSTINKAAYLFGSLFILEGIIFFIYGFVNNKLVLIYSKDIFSITGILFILYALLIYPVLGYFFGREYRYSITLGLPCPTTIFTFGILLLIKKKISLAVLSIPLIWSLIGLSAVLNFSVYEDFGLLISGLIGITLLIKRNRKINLEARAA
jgi:hypothetical protein